MAALEESLRRDLGDAVKAKMSDLIVNGVAPTNANPQHVEGFIAKLTGVDDTAIADAARYGRFHAEAVDGIHATMETEVMSVIGDETYRHAAGTYLTGSAVSGTELLRTRSAGCMGSSYIPDAQGNIQQSDPARGRPQWRRDHEGRQRCGRLAYPRNHPGYLHGCEHRRHADVGHAMGCRGRIPRRRLQAPRNSNRLVR